MEFYFIHFSFLGGFNFNSCYEWSTYTVNSFYLLQFSALCLCIKYLTDYGADRHGNQSSLSDVMQLVPFHDILVKEEFQITLLLRVLGAS